MSPSMPTPGDRAAIEWLVGQLHVGTPDDAIRADMLRRCRVSGFAYPNGYEEACAAYAIQVHNRNRELYRTVMGGMS